MLGMAIGREATDFELVYDISRVTSISHIDNFDSVSNKSTNYFLKISEYVKEENEGCKKAYVRGNNATQFNSLICNRLCLCSQLPSSE